MRLGLDHLPRQWLRLRWPRELTTEQVAAALHALNGLSTPWRSDAVVLQVVGTSEGIEHQLAVPEARAEATSRQLRQAITGLSIEFFSPTPLSVTRAWRVWLSTRRRPLAIDRRDAVAAGLLAALGSAEGDEALVLQWLLGPVRRPLAVPTKMAGDASASAWRLITAPFVAPGELDNQARRALLTKQGLPGWRAVGRLAVRAAGIKRQRQLLGRVSAALRTAQASGVALGVRPTRTNPVEQAAVPLFWPLALNVEEMVGLAAWPLGPLEGLPIQRASSRLLPPPRSVPSRGRVVARATFPGHERDLALGVRDSLQHLHVLGPTGVGKSTLLLNLICQDLAAGCGLVVIEPKGDLIDDVLGRVPAKRRDDIVVLDPADDRRPVGLNPLAKRGQPAELVVDQLLAVFHGLYADNWGPRLQDVLHAGLLTLTSQPGLTLCHLPLLYTNPAFRRRLVGGVGEDIALGPFWAWFNGLSDPERAVVLAPVMNKLRAFLLRPRVRAVLGQAEPRFDLRQVLTERKVLLVNLAKGLLGPEAASLLGSLVVSQLWQAVLSRSAIAPDRRHPVFVFVDEWQDYVRLPTDLGEVLAQSRGLGVGLTLAHQHLAQLTPSLRAGVLANARSRVVFQSPYDDAALLVRGHAELVPEDIADLGPYEVYAQLVAEGNVRPFASARTLLPPPPQADANALRQRSRERYGIDRTTIEAELTALITPKRAESTSPLGSRPRRADPEERR